MRKLLVTCVLMLAMIGPVVAVTPEEILPNPQLEARARALSAQFRCLVCQNESIDASDAALAADLRKIVRERIVAGQSDAQIKKFMVARYGEFVLLKPPFDTSTLLLWGTPVLVVGLWALVMLARGKKVASEPEVPPLNADEEARLAHLVETGG